MKMMEDNPEKINEEKKNLTKKFKFFFNRANIFNKEADRNRNRIKLREFLKNKIIFWLSIFAFIVNAANWLVLMIFIQPVDLPLILHYNVYFGVDIMGNWREVFFSPAIGIVLFIINFLLAFYFYKSRERIISYLLMIGTLMIQCGMLIYSISLIVINY